MPIAKAIEKKWGVPAEVTIAQAALESGWGKKVKGNAYFGIKGKGSKGSVNFGTHEVINGKKIGINDNFASYGGFADAANGYGEFLNKNKRYREAFKHKDNPVEFAKAVARAGYATDPEYANKLTSIIKSNKFV
ncbi:glycoside hydrolase family 73 protein [Aggregatibacter actinomycetemcomitans]|uniref:glycoside hydrolase family 73 protein n=1 Tax=Aggregatibacter actinomycetemcomitans TaxID=714 RepID=UPI00197B57D8|nr:glucosaminidase domain-containing protein [Aggregatibacter actinomycetemcomitans]MBN6058681.1 glucosaminidase domain-containing protein [Aggregatibacter actinomycetemcomitans]MBN6087190.1 glucosaminidase domain-containing protein [Aggregatibacter actinomycetemcomitans]